jgi:hypothetical protein
LLTGAVAGCGDDGSSSAPAADSETETGTGGDAGTDGAAADDDASPDESGTRGGESGESDDGSADTGGEPVDHVDLYFLSRMTCMNPDPCPDFGPVIACAVDECDLDDIYTTLPELPIPDPASTCFDYALCMSECECDGFDPSPPLQGGGTCQFASTGCDRDCAESCEAGLDDGPCKARLDEAWSCAQDAACFTEACEAYGITQPSVCDELATCCVGLDAALQMQCDMALDAAGGDEDSCGGILLGYQSSGLC